MKILIALLVLISFPVHAQGYFGVGIGEASVDISRVAGFTNVIDDSGANVKVFAGLHLSPALAFEATYAQADDISRTITDGVDVRNDQLETSSFTFAGVGFLDLTRVRLFGKLGVTRASVDDNVILNGVQIATLSDTSTEPMLGLGADFQLFQELWVRAEFERHKDVGGPDVGESDVDIFGVAALFRF